MLNINQKQKRPAIYQLGYPDRRTNYSRRTTRALNKRCYRCSGLSYNSICQVICKAFLLFFKLSLLRKCVRFLKLEIVNQKWFILRFYRFSILTITSYRQLQYCYNYHWTLLCIIWLKLKWSIKNKLSEES